MNVCTLNGEHFPSKLKRRIVMQKTLRRSGLAITLAELADSGSDVDVSLADSEREHADLEIRQVGGVNESMVFELPSGLTGCILDLVITNQTSRTIYCADNELRFPWEDSLLTWLPDPLEVGKTESYRFPGGSRLEFDRDVVINHVLEDGRLTPKCPLRGLLLATGGLMPKNLQHGGWVDATFVLTASDHAEYLSTVRLWTERLEVKPKRAKRKYNLCDEEIGHGLGFKVAVGDEPTVACDSESVKPLPTLDRLIQRLSR
jgi:hypothetical protein